MSDDELTPFADEPVFRALTGPGTPAELAGEAEMLAAFMAAVPKRARRRYAARLGAGGSVFIAAAALSGGVAAASYTNSLPRPAQNLAHTIVGWAGVPKAPPAHHPAAKPPAAAPVVTPTGGDTPRTVVSPGPAGSPSATPTQRPQHGGVVPGSRVHSPSPAASLSASPSVSASPRATPTPVVTPTPTSTLTAPVPAALSVSVSAIRVPANTGLTLSGELTTAGGAPVPDHSVTAYENPTGGGERYELGSGTTDENGDVSFAVPALSHSVRLVLRAEQGLHSTTVTVVEVPTVSATVIANGTVESIGVSTVGATPGDTVLLLRRQQGAWLTAGQGELDSTGATTFAVPAATARTVRYRVVLQRTSAHAQSAVGCSAVPS